MHQAQQPTRTRSHVRLERGRKHRRLLTGRQWGRIAKSLRLSPRESQVVRCIFDSLAESAIAAEAGISRHTVHSYVRRVYYKLGIHDRCDLLIRVFDAHLAIEAERST